MLLLQAKAVTLSVQQLSATRALVLLALQTHQQAKSPSQSPTHSQLWHEPSQLG